MIKFISPLILASVGAFYVACADKYFLRLFGSLSEVGLYALAARVSSILATVFEVFSMSWGADRFEIVKKEFAKNIFEQVFRFLSLVLMVLGAVMAIFANDLFQVMTSPEFYSVSYVVLILIVVTLARIYVLFCNFGALYGERTGVMVSASWLKVVVATIGYLTLIPLMDVYGAAVALMLSNLVELSWVYWQSAKIYDMGLKLRPVMIIFSVAAASVLIGLLTPEGELTGFFFRLLIFSLLLLLLYKLPIWSSAEKKKVSSLLSGKIKFVSR